MAQVLNGGQVTITTEEDIIPVDVGPDGDYIASGRNVFMFELVSGSVQMGVGAVIDVGDFTHASRSTAGEKWVHTASPSIDLTISSGHYGNIRAKGSTGVVKVTW